MKYAASVLDLVGGTPLLALDRINPPGGGRVLGKCEFLNPIAIKDRPALWMIREAERREEIGPGTTLAGGVGIGEGTLAGVASAVLPGVAVGNWATLGGGAVVTAPVPSGATVVGVPARSLGRSVDRTGL